jgi:hypothetical protein
MRGGYFGRRAPKFTETMITPENCLEVTRRGVGPSWELTAGASSCVECDRERARGSSRPAYVPAPVLCLRCRVPLCLLHGWNHSRPGLVSTAGAALPAARVSDARRLLAGAGAFDSAGAD